MLVFLAYYKGGTGRAARPKRTVLSDSVKTPFRPTILLLALSVSQITQAGSCEEFSSLTEIRGSSRMVIGLTEKRGGGKRGKEKTLIRNGGVEEAVTLKRLAV